MLNVLRSAPISLTIVSGFVRLIDVAICVAAAALAFAVYLHGKPITHGDFVIYTVILSMFVQIIAFQVADLYKLTVLHDLKHQIHRVWLAWTLVFVILVVLGFVTKSSEQISRGWIILWFASGLVLFTVLRVGIHLFFVQCARRGLLRRKIVVVGGGEVARQVIQDLKRMGPELHTLGFFDDREERVPEEIDGCPRLGEIDDVLDFAREHHPDLIIVAVPFIEGERLIEILRQLWILPVDVRLSGQALGVRFSPDVYSYIGNIPLLNVFKNPISDWDFVLKTVEDRVIAVLCLAFAFPLMLLIALLIKLDSPGPVFFRQKRRGFNNRFFAIYKFRTFKHDCSDWDAAKLASKDDDRVTRVGRFLRRTSLDELPQLLNVLNGDMSIVGPRPHATLAKADGQLYQDVVESYFARHRVKPGITGWAQINGWRGETDTVEKIQRRIEYDLYFIENWSIWFDLKIILLTPVAVLRTSNAY